MSKKYFVADFAKHFDAHKQVILLVAMPTGSGLDFHKYHEEPYLR